MGYFRGWVNQLLVGVPGVCTYRLRSCVELPEIAGIVGYENKIIRARVAQNIPVFRAGFADVRNVMRFVAGLGRDGHELNAETLVDQEPHVSPDLSKPFTGTLHRRTVTPRLRPRPATDRIGLGKDRCQTDHLCGEAWIAG